ncbi:hypothetical protein MIR68_011045 [Amoeboaphelidium protococcarum]|nr:hypothetical protein MIR68_011045 [Amoeboaphelidium protococcarum]
MISRRQKEQTTIIRGKENNNDEIAQIKMQNKMKQQSGAVQKTQSKTFVKQSVVDILSADGGHLVKKSQMYSAVSTTTTSSVTLSQSSSSNSTDDQRDKDISRLKAKIPLQKGSILHDNVVDTTTLHPHRNIADDVVHAVHKAKRIVIVTGAGISVSGGIPDFRSMNGLYNMVKQKYPDAVVKGKDIFDAHLFKDEASTKVFYSFMAELKQMVDKASPTEVHQFLKNVKDKGKLLRCYTQNIDCMEERLSMTCDLEDKKSDVVMLHGTLQYVSCTVCKHREEFNDVHSRIFSGGEPPACPRCLSSSQQRERASKRSLPIGILRPDIILYSEHHSACDTIGQCWESDLKKRPDLLLVMGTTLKVAGIKTLVRDFARQVKSLDDIADGGGDGDEHFHNGSGVNRAKLNASTKNRRASINPPKRPIRTVLINKTPIGAEWKDLFDVTWLGEADSICAHIWSIVNELDHAMQARKKKHTSTILPKNKNNNNNNKTTMNKSLKSQSSGVVEKKSIKVDDELSVSTKVKKLTLKTPLSPSAASLDHPASLKAGTKVSPKRTKQSGAISDNPFVDSRTNVVEML